MEKVINFTSFWVGTFVQGGFNFGIDFRAGLNQQISISGAADISEVKQALSGIDALQVQTVGSGSSRNYMIRTGVDESNKDFQSETEALIKQKLESAFGAGSVTVLSTEVVGARFAGSLTS